MQFPPETTQMSCIHILIANRCSQLGMHLYFTESQGWKIYLSAFL